MIRITRVYTKTGDRGETHLAGGQRAPKDSPRIEAYGGVDELSSVLGAARVEAERSSLPAAARDRLSAAIRRIQNELFNLGAELAMVPEDVRPDTPRVQARHTEQLERELDEMNETLEPLKSFVLPGGGPVGASLHVARAVCRRVEREIVRLARTNHVPEEAVRYLNRLSDWLFVAARWSAKQAGEAEPLWEPEKT